MANENEKSVGLESAPAELQFFFQKSNFYREVHVDGAYGGWTPTGYLHVALYNQRLPIAKSTVHPVVTGSQLGEEDRSRRDTLEGIVRQVEVGLYFDETSARKLHGWLGDKLKEFEAIKGD